MYTVKHYSKLCGSCAECSYGGCAYNIELEAQEMGMSLDDFVNDSHCEFYEEWQEEDPYEYEDEYEEWD